MNEVLKIALTASISFVVTAVLTALVTRYKWKKGKINEIDGLSQKLDSVQQSQETLKQSQQQLASSVKSLMNTDVEVLKEGMRHMLRNTLMEDHNRAMSDGYCTQEMKNEIENTYNTYHALNGNGVATALYTQIMQLPLSPKE